jgi:hypothetical protein
MILRKDGYKLYITDMVFVRFGNNPALEIDNGDKKRQTKVIIQNCLFDGRVTFRKKLKLCWNILRNNKDMTIVYDKTKDIEDKI